jgi:hypothetical protein
MRYMEYGCYFLQGIINLYSDGIWILTLGKNRQLQSSQPIHTCRVEIPSIYQNKFRIKESNNLYANNIGIDADIYQISKEVSEQNKDKFVLNLMIFFADAI